MKIAFITYEYPPDTGKGGIGTYTNQIAAALTIKDWDVHVFSGTNKESYYQVENNYSVHRINCENPIEFRNKVLAPFSIEHQQKPFDIIESPEIHGNAWEIKKSFTSIPLVVRLHAPDWLVENLKKKYIPFFSKLRFFFGAFKRLKWDLGYWRSYDKNADPDYQFTKLADGVTAPSSVMKDWAVSNWHFEEKRIAVIANIFTPSSALLSIPITKQNFKTVLFFGRLNVLKGLVNASKAMLLILQEYPDWNFVVIGDDGQGIGVKKSMRQWMKTKMNKVIDRVSFYDGLVYEDLPQAISKSSIVLLPSLFESFSYTCVEAMAAGKVVVGSRNTGMADIIQDERNGLLVNQDDCKEIYKAIKKLIINPSLRQELSIQARMTASEKFTNKAINASMEYYKKISNQVQ